MPHGGLALPRGKTLEPLHLLKQGRDVLHPRLGYLIAQINQLRVVVDDSPPIRPRLASAHVIDDAPEARLFVADNTLKLGVGFCLGRCAPGI
jgi:hypothetical protein